MLTTAVMLCPTWARENDLPTIRVAKGRLTRVQREFGVIEAGKTQTVYNQVDGEIIWIAPEGAHVQEGDPVVKLSNNVIEVEAEENTMRLEDREIRVRQSKTDHELQKREAQFTLKRKEMEVRSAEWELRDLKQRATTLQLRRIELDADIAKYEMEHAKLELEAVKALQGTTLEATEELKEKTTAYERAIVDFEKANGLLKAARKGPNRRQIEVAEKRLERARQGLALQKLSNQEQARVSEASLEMERAYLSRSRYLAERHQRRAKQLTVPAPMAGTVRLMDVWKGEGEEHSPIRVGESRNNNMDLLKIADLSTLLVRIHVSEADISLVQVGQRAEIRLVAFPDKVYRGEVHEIAPFAADKNIKLGSLAMYRDGVAGVNVVDVLVKIVDQDARLRLGLTARVDLTVIDRQNVLTLPHTAVRLKDGQAVCYVRNGQRAEPRKIELGPANEHAIVVSSGLKEGESVLVDARAAERSDKALPSSDL